MVHQFQYDVFSHGHPGAGVGTIISVAPPLWFMEGMAEYLSIGPIDPHTAMWLRDASLEGHLPTIEQLTYDPRIFPYRFGHALWAYVGEKWGGEGTGEILQRPTPGGGGGGGRSGPRTPPAARPGGEAAACLRAPPPPAHAPRRALGRRPPPPRP